MMVRVVGRILAALVVLALCLFAYGYGEATSTPRVVRYTVHSTGWTAPPITIALISDTHAVLPDMPPERLDRICDQVTAQKPDLILLAGDYSSRRTVRIGPVGAGDATAPFAHLRARLGVFAVLGNHDMYSPGLAEAVAAGLRRAGITVLRNGAARTGDIWIAGADDGDYGSADVDVAIAQVPAGAPAIFVVHNPDNFERVPNRVALTVAGHTHGGQVAPWFTGAIMLPIHHRAWARGLVWDKGRAMVVTSGVGASGVPVRIGVPPEIALIRLEGVSP